MEQSPQELLITGLLSLLSDTTRTTCQGWYCTVVCPHSRPRKCLIDMLKGQSNGGNFSALFVSSLLSVKLTKKTNSSCSYGSSLAPSQASLLRFLLILAIKSCIFVHIVVLLLKLLHGACFLVIARTICLPPCSPSALELMTDHKHKIQAICLVAVSKISARMQAAEALTRFPELGL